MVASDAEHALLQCLSAIMLQPASRLNARMFGVNITLQLPAQHREIDSILLQQCLLLQCSSGPKTNGAAGYQAQHRATN